MKVWIIEQGEYSDYRVVGIFSTEENAKKYMDKIKKNVHGYDDPSIDERELDPSIEDINAGRSQYYIRFDQEGNITNIELSDDIQECREAHYGGNDRFPATHLYILWAEDEAHAIKIASDRFYQYLATKAHP